MRLSKSRVVLLASMVASSFLSTTILAADTIEVGKEVCNELYRVFRTSTPEHEDKYDEEVKKCEFTPVGDLEFLVEVDFDSVSEYTKFYSRDSDVCKTKYKYRKTVDGTISCVFTKDRTSNQSSEYYLLRCGYNNINLEYSRTKSNYRRSTFGFCNWGTGVSTSVISSTRHFEDLLAAVEWVLERYY